MKDRGERDREEGEERGEGRRAARHTGSGAGGGRTPEQATRSTQFRAFVVAHGVGMCVPGLRGASSAEHRRGEERRTAQGRDAEGRGKAQRGQRAPAQRREGHSQARTPRDSHPLPPPSVRAGSFAPPHPVVRSAPCWPVASSGCHPAGHQGARAIRVQHALGPRRSSLAAWSLPVRPLRALPAGSVLTQPRTPPVLSPGANCASGRKSEGGGMSAGGFNSLGSTHALWEDVDSTATADSLACLCEPARSSHSPSSGSRLLCASSRALCSLLRSARRRQSCS
jgi:hypothetical protein